MGSTFGSLFRVTSFGESHGGGVGAIVDGCPPRLPLTAEDIQTDLDRRRPGQSRIVTQRKESDTVEILSGLVDGLTLGTPIMMLIRNEDQRSTDYSEFAEKYRPSHADFTYDAKYGIRAVAGGGRASARETAARVAAGAVAKKIIAAAGGSICGFVRRVQNIETEMAAETVTPELVEANIVRCPEQAVAERMIERIEEIRKEGNSVGGVVECVCHGIPGGLGEPVFDKLEADLAKAMLSIPAVKGFEIGSGFAGTHLTGLDHNDAFTTDADGRITTKTNNSGGIQGGISNGMPIIFRVAFKPTATVMRDQETVTKDGAAAVLKGRGRHDPCVLPRAVPIVEAMAALVLADHLLRQRVNEFVPR